MARANLPLNIGAPDIPGSPPSLGELALSGRVEYATGLGAANLVAGRRSVPTSSTATTRPSTPDLADNRQASFVTPMDGPTIS